MRVLKFAVAACSFASAQAGITAIVSGLTNSYTAMNTMFSQSAESLRANDMNSEAKMLEEFSNKWLSIMKMEGGLGGLASDFAMNYLNQSTYHNSNGPLISAMKRVQKMATEKQSDGVHSAVMDMAKQGIAIFKSKGSLNSMFKDMEKLVKNDNIFKTINKSLQSPDVQDLLQFVAGPRANAGADEMDEEEEL